MRRLAALLLILLAFATSGFAHADEEDGGGLEPPGLAASAARYRDAVTAKRPPQPQPGEAIAAIAAADRDEAAGRADAAIAGVERALRLGASEDAAARWLRLSRLWLERPGAPDPARAAEAAWLAQQTATDDAGRDTALLAVADILDQRLNRASDALALLRAMQAGGSTPEGLAPRLAALAPRVGLEWKRTRIEAEGDEPRACLRLTGALRRAVGVRFEDYVAVEPAVPSLLAEAAGDDELCLSGLAHGGRYRVTLREGLPGEGGLTLRQTVTREVAVGDRSPSVAFRGGGFILPRLGPQGVPLTTVNLDAVTLDVYRINDRNLVAEAARRFPGALDRWTAEQIESQLGERVWRGRMPVGNERNKAVVTAIPVGRLLGTPKPGLYAIIAAPADQPGSGYGDEATQWLVVSDLALSALRGVDGLDLVARSIATAKPMAGASVALLARNNAELGRTTTDADGRARFDRTLTGGSGGNEPALAVAYGPEGDFAALDLERPALDLADRGIAGRQPPGPLDAYLYTDRGVYRPGERVNVTALLRDDRAAAVDGVPLTLKVLRPNGTVLRSGVVPPAVPGVHVLPIEIGKAAPLGSWTVEAYADPAAPAIGRVPFQVEEFVPERLAVEATGSAPVVEPGRPFDLLVSSRFLYGPPAAGLEGTVELSLAADPDPYPAAFPGYRFGLVQEEVTARTRELPLPAGDAEGRARVAVELPPLPDTTRPLRAEFRVAVAEPGGRPSRATLAVPVRTQPFAVGVRPLFADGQIDERGEAGFELVAVGPDGTRVARPGLKTELFAERVTYQWYRQDGAYNYRTLVRSESLRRGEVDVAADAPVRAVFGPLDYGRYRLEVSDPATGVATSVRFAAGWQASASSAADRPDEIRLSADKAAYLPGETARVRVEAPFAGEMQATIATDRVLGMRQLPLPAEGATVDVPVGEDWGGAGAYVLVTALRPPVEGREHLPVRAVGVAWLPLDTRPRTLSVTLPADLLGTVRPRQRLELPVRVAGADGAPAAGAWVTLAAVDEGILRLTGFASPDPAKFYFGKRALGLDLRDDYGRLITGVAGPMGEPRQGGDQGGLGAALPDVPLTIVSLFQGPVLADAEGVARFTLDLPDFAGELRLMVVAGNGGRLGAASAPLPVRGPVVADLVLPRFLAPGDQARVTVSLHNLEGAAGTYRVAVEGSGAAVVAEGGRSEVALDRGARATLTARLDGVAAGGGRVRVAVEGPDGFAVAHELPITVRPARPPETLFSRRLLQPGDTSAASADALAPYLPGTAALRLGYATTPPLDLAGTLASLDRYPYGCLEQATSRGLPLVALGALGPALGQAAGGGLPLDARIDDAVGRVLDKQRFDGAFGLWSAYGAEEPWLTAYATEFLARARARGRPVPDAPFQAALDWLKRQAVDGGTEPADLAARAYAVHVLALSGVATPSVARYLHDGFLDRLPTPLAKGQLAAALSRLGDAERARGAAEAATGKLTRDFWYEDYGSTVRDAAALVTVLGEVGLLGDRLPRLLDRLPATETDARRTNTQEQAWIALAGARLLANAGPVAPRLDVTGTVSGGGLPLFLTPSAAELARGVQVANAGPGEVWEALTLTGVPREPRPAAREGLAIRRQFLTREGEPLNLDAVRQNDVFVVRLEGETSTGVDHQALVTHGLPAGWEIENPRLGGEDARGLAWLGELSEPVAVEARDDRYVAALDLTPDEPAFRLAYLVRAVTPGTYELPGAAVEDMYRPGVFARQAAGRITVLPR